MPQTVQNRDERAARDLFSVALTASQHAPPAWRPRDAPPPRVDSVQPTEFTMATLLNAVSACRALAQL